MLRQLATTTSSRIQISSFTPLSRQLSQNIAVFAHHFLRDFHLFDKFGVVGRKLKTIRRFQNVESIAFNDAKLLHQLFRENYPCTVLGV